MNAIICTEEARNALHSKGVAMEQTAKFRHGMVRLVVPANLHRQLSLQIAPGETLSDAVMRLYR